MLKGMFGGALMVALLAGGVFVWAKLSGQHGKMGYGHRGEMSYGQDMTQPSDAATTEGSTSGQGVTLAEATASASDGHNHAEGMTHDMSAMEMGTTGTPTEPGQGAFAAVSEIVKMLMADPDTDWQKVNIAALREHLVDMDMLITNAEVETVEIKNGIEMTVNLSGPGGDAASRMVPAHAPVLAAETGWESTVEVSGNTAIWHVVSAENVAQIRALGFYGLMAMGDHHREHHFGMASGAMVH